MEPTYVISIQDICLFIDAISNGHVFTLLRQSLFIYIFFFFLEDFVYLLIFFLLSYESNVCKQTYGFILICMKFVDVANIILLFKRHTHMTNYSFRWYVLEFASGLTYFEEEKNLRPILLLFSFRRKLGKIWSYEILLLFCFLFFLLLINQNKSLKLILSATNEKKFSMIFQFCGQAMRPKTRKIVLFMLVIMPEVFRPKLFFIYFNNSTMSLIVFQYVAIFFSSLYY